MQSDKTSLVSSINFSQEQYRLQYPHLTEEQVAHATKAYIMQLQSGITRKPAYDKSHYQEVRRLSFPAVGRQFSMTFIFSLRFPGDGQGKGPADVHVPGDVQPAAAEHGAAAAAADAAVRGQLPGLDLCQGEGRLDESGNWG